MKMFAFMLLAILTGCTDSAVNKFRSAPCTMQLIDKCRYTLSNGDLLWMNSYSTAETEVPYHNGDSECRDAANRYSYTAPTMFSFLNGYARAADALQPDGSYRFKGSNAVEFTYKWTGSAEFTKSEETGVMTCEVEISGRTHDL